MIERGHPDLKSSHHTTHSITPSLSHTYSQKKSKHQYEHNSDDASDDEEGDPNQGHSKRHSHHQPADNRHYHENNSRHDSLHADMKMVSHVLRNAQSKANQSFDLIHTPEVIIDSNHKPDINLAEVDQIRALSRKNNQVSAALSEIHSDTHAEIEKIRSSAVQSPHDIIGRYATMLKNNLETPQKSLSNELFSWLFCECFNGFRNSFPGQCVVILLLLFFYCFGLSLFLIQLQIIEECDANLIPLHVGGYEGPTDSCAGISAQCVIDGTITTFKAYIQFRTAAYILLLIPFLYIPFRIIYNMESAIDNSNRLVRELVVEASNDVEEMLGQTADNSEANIAKRLKEFEDKKNQNDLTFLVQNLRDNVKNMSNEGHERCLIALFFFFHFLIGIFSMILDGCLYTRASSMSSGTNDPCYLAQQAANQMGPSALTGFQFLGFYQLMLGCLFQILMLCYMCIQITVNINKQAEIRLRQLHTELSNVQTSTANRIRTNQSITAAEHSKFLEQAGLLYKRGGYGQRSSSNDWRGDGGDYGDGNGYGDGNDGWGGDGDGYDNGGGSRHERW